MICRVRKMMLCMLVMPFLGISGFSAAPSNSLRAGFATTDITPPLGVDLCGYGYYLDRKATAVQDHLLARAAVFESGGRRIAIVGTDLVGVTLQITEAVRKEVARATGIPGAHVMVNATHTHSGPATLTCISCGEMDDKYLSTLPGKIAQAIILASQRLQAVRTSYGEAKVEGVALNREYEGGPIDEYVRVLKFMRGNRLAGFISHYTVHPVIFGPESHLITGDLVEVAEDKVLSDYPGAVGIYLQGPAGDINPVTCCLPEKEGLVKLDQLSNLLANGMRVALNSAAPVNTDPVNMDAREISLPRVPPDRSLVVLRMLDAERMLKRKDLSEDMRGEIRFQRDSAAAVLNRFDHPPLTETVSEIQVARLGDLLIVGCPGELFITLGKQTADLLPGYKVLVDGYTNDLVDYFPTQDKYDLIGGASGWAAGGATVGKYTYDYAAYFDPWFYGEFHLGSNVGDVLVQGMVKLARDVIGEGAP